MSRPLLIILYLIIFTKICFSQSDWLQQNSGTTANLYSIRFLDSLTGICIGDSGKILRTTNGGNNWIQVKTGFHNNLKSLFFTANNIGYIAGDSGLVLKSLDQGNSWFRLNLVKPKHNFTSIFFVNDSIGFLGGRTTYFVDTNKFFRTFDGGINWDSILYVGDYIKLIFFINPATGWIVDNSKGPLGGAFLIKTTSGGTNWFPQYNLPYLFALYFGDSLNGWLSGYGEGPTMYRTTDGGTNWEGCWFCGLGPSSSLFFIDNFKGWGSGDDVVYYTINGGVNWSFQNVTQSVLRSVYFIDSVKGWVAGDHGTILKADEIITNHTFQSSEIPDGYSLSQNYPNPFNPTTKISYSLPNTQYIILKVYDVLGNEVATLVNQKQNAGKYQVEFDGSDLPSGIYLYRLEADGEILDTKQMLLLK